VTDAIVGIGTFFVVVLVVGAPLLIIYGRSLPTTAAADQAEWLDQTARDLAKWLIAGQGVALLILPVLLFIALISGVTR
jgi:hypothetical protein